MGLLIEACDYKIQSAPSVSSVPIETATEMSGAIYTGWINSFQPPIAVRHLLGAAVRWAGDNRSALITGARPFVRLLP